MGYCIAQVGSFDVENFGDLLFPDVFKYYMPADCEVDLFSPNGGIKPFTKKQVVYPISELERRCKERKYRAIIIGGGDVVRIDNSVTPDYAQGNNSVAMSLWVTPILIGNKYDIPVLFNAPGVPFRFYENEKLFVKNMLRMTDYISVRDETSKELINECGVKDTVCIPDTLFNSNIYGKSIGVQEIFETLKEKYPIFKMHKYIIFQHNRWLTDKNAESLRRAVEKITDETDYSVIFFPIGYVHNDGDGLKKIYDKNNKKCGFFTEKLNPNEMMSVLAFSAGYIGTSMHGGIVSWAFGKPIIMLDEGGTATKITGFQRHIGKNTVSLMDYRRLYEKFENVFIKGRGISFNRLSIINEQVDRHFKKMRKMIESDDSGHVSLDKVFVETYNSLSHDERNFHAEIIVYFDTGEGFNIWNRKVYAINDLNRLSQTFLVPEGTKKVLLQITDAEALIINNFEIKEDGRLIKYEIPNMAYVGRKNHLFFFEPASVVFNCDGASRKFRVTAQLESPKSEDFRDLLLKMRQKGEKEEHKNRVLEQEKNNLRQEKNILQQEKEKFDRVRRRKVYRVVNKIARLE